MGLESVTFISDLVSTNPVSTDLKSAGDDHIRRIKSALLNTFPLVTGAVSVTHMELNALVGVTDFVQDQIDNHTHDTTAIVSGTLGVEFGGTGLSSATVGAFLLGNGVNAFVPTEAVTAVQTMLNGITSIATDSMLVYDGDTWVARDSINIQTAIATTSGAYKDWTGIPSWVKRISVIFRDVTTNGTSPIIIQLGTGGVPQTIDYLGAVQNSGATANHTNGFRMRAANGIAGEIFQGVMTLTRMAESGDLVNFDTWAISGNIALSSSANSWWVAGHVTITGGAMDMLRLTTVGGANTFVGGQVNLVWE